MTLFFIALGFILGIAFSYWLFAVGEMQTQLDRANSRIRALQLTLFRTEQQIAKKESEK